MQGIISLTVAAKNLSQTIHDRMGFFLGEGGLTHLEALDSGVTRAVLSTILEQHWEHII